MTTDLAAIDGLLDRARQTVDAERRAICEALGEWYRTRGCVGAPSAAEALEAAIEDAGHVRPWAVFGGWTDAMTLPITIAMVETGSDWQIEAGDRRPAIVLSPDAIIR